MRRCFVFLLAITLGLSIFPAAVCGNENSQAEKKMSTPMQEPEPACKCTPISRMDLSAQQVQAIDTISLKYNNKFLQLRSQIILKQMEVMALLRNPDIGEKDILAAAVEIGNVRSELETAGIQCQVEIRRVLTADQIRSWCNLETPPLKRAW